MTDSRETTTNPVKVNHKLASMLDVTPTYPIAQQKSNDEHIEKSKNNKIAVIYSFVGVYNVAFLFNNHVLMNHIVKEKSFTDSFSLVFFTLAFIMAIINSLWLEKVYKKSASYEKLSKEEKEKRIKLIFLIYSVLFAATL